MTNINQNQMDAIRECIQKQDKYQEYIDKINVRVKTLIAAKKKFEAAFDANRVNLTSILSDLNIRATYVDRRRVSMGYWSRVEVTDESEIPSDYLKKRTVIDKNKLRMTLIKNPNAHIDGATLVTYKKAYISKPQKD